MRITALAGGIGAARFLRGLSRYLAAEPIDGHLNNGVPDGVPPAARPAVDITVVGNTADDVTLHGLRICPDLDTVMYTLGGGICESQGWGRADETHTIASELREYGAADEWFSLGDRDTATHLVRTALLARGHGLAEVTRTLCERWRPGVTLLPMTEDRVETHVLVDRDLLRAARRRAAGEPDPNDQYDSSQGVTPRNTFAEPNSPDSYDSPDSRGSHGGDPKIIHGHNETIVNVTDPSSQRNRSTAGTEGFRKNPDRYEKIHFQEWWVRLKAGVPAREIIAVGAESSRPAPGVLEAIATADVILLPPSNPIVSIGSILSVPGIRQALRDSPAPVVGVSPIVAGAPVRGMADACLAARGLPTTASAVAGLYADFLDAWLIDERDTAPGTVCGTVPGPGSGSGPGAVRRPVVRALPLIMSDLEQASRIAGQALQVALELRESGPVTR